MRKASGNMGIDRAEALKFEHLRAVSANPESDELPRNLRSIDGGRTAYSPVSKTPDQRAKDMRFRRIMIIAGALSVLLMYYAEDSVLDFLSGTSPARASEIYIPYTPPKSRAIAVASPEISALRGAFCSVAALKRFCL